MEQDDVVSLRRADDPAEDPLTELRRYGARALLAQAIEAEVAAFLASHADQLHVAPIPLPSLRGNAAGATAWR